MNGVAYATEFTNRQKKEKNITSGKGTPLKQLLNICKTPLKPNKKNVTKPIHEPKTKETALLLLLLPPPLSSYCHNELLLAPLIAKTPPSPLQ